MTKQHKLKLEDLENPAKKEEVGKSVHEHLLSGGTMQDVLGYTDEMLATRYNEARDHFMREDFEKAAEGFSYLAALNHYEAKYWQSLGTTQMHWGDVVSAINSYTIATATDPTNPESLYYAARCFMDLGDTEEALNALQGVVEIAKAGGHKYRPLEDRAQELLNTLK